MWKARWELRFHDGTTLMKSHFANATDPSVPAGLSGLILAIHGLNDFKLKARAKGRTAKYTSGSSGFQSLAPDDIGALYDIKPLWNAVASLAQVNRSS